MKKLKNTIRLSIIVWLLFAGSMGAAAQQEEKKIALEALHQLSARYREPEGLSFDMIYRYANEASPAVYLDSLTGKLKLSGNRYWCKMANTESIHTGKYLIMLFGDDNIMYLAKPPANSTSIHPMAMLDSLLINNEGIICSTKEQDGYKSVKMEFAGPSSCKSITYYIDTKSGYLFRMVSIVRAELLYESAARDLLEGPPTYAIVEADFFNYRQGGLDNELFNSNRYFRKGDNGFVTVAPYNNYKIFIGSPGLESNR